MNIQRRTFLKGLAAVPMVRPLAKAGQLPAATSEFHLNQFFVAGFQFYEGPGLMQAIRCTMPKSA